MQEYKKILLRLGELTLKGKNRKMFTLFLIKNIEKIVNVKVSNQYDRLFIDYSLENLKNLQYVFGLSSYSPVWQVTSDINKITQFLQELIFHLDKATFKIEVIRHDKNISQTSMELNAKWGKFIVDNSQLKVDVRNPDNLIEIEIRKEFTYIFFKRIRGLGGLPVGVNGKVLHLISGGIDSPVAAFEMMKRGIHIDYLNFITPPQTDEKTVEKVKKIITLLDLYQKKSCLYQINFSDLLNLINLSSRKEYRINLMRRSFYRIASLIATKKGYLGISNGENLNQVASQTLESIITIESQSRWPIYRPLLTYDKNEIIVKAKKINTYELSIVKANETCELFAPPNPIIKPSENISQKLDDEMQPDLKILENNSITKKMVIIYF